MISNRKLLCLKQGREAAARYHYDQGMAAYRANDLVQAIHHLELAADYQPANEEYRERLAEVSVVAGGKRDPRVVHIGDQHHRLNVIQQERWVEIRRNIDIGQQGISNGDFDLAESKFEVALIRLQNLPFADENRELEVRRVENLLVEVQQRRREIDQAQQASEREQAQQLQYEQQRRALQIEQDRIDAMLARALKARERRDYDECILLCEQILRSNRAESRAHDSISSRTPRTSRRAPSNDCRYLGRRA